ncbi:MAG: hypothetical protein B6U89_02980 [Desulfurococcales archaeon ex4484_58]|nr:MAG: hypothetical protein B6U89_02980 [Desulfurococcales archaeon ex4484_58]
MDQRYREALKKILELRNREKGGKTRRSIEESVRIGLLAKKLFNKYYRVVKWEKEERVLEMKI